MMKTALLIALGIVSAGYIAYWIGASRKSRPDYSDNKGFHFWIRSGIGFVTNFLDTLGIGSFATTTSSFKFLRGVKDEAIPGTLNVGHAIPTAAEALIFIAIVTVDLRTLIAMIAAAVLGAWLGAGIVARWPRRTVQIGMGFALFCAAGLFLMKQLNLFPEGGVSFSLDGTRFVIGLIGNFALGALMTLGIGLYAPCMILVSLLGMDPKAAFPIMMGSCAFLMPAGSVRFIKSGRYDWKAALGLTIGGVPGVLIAAYLVKSLPLKYVIWLVIVVVLYTAAMMLRSAFKESVAAAPQS
ncbi:MAG TPA: sulfite exporter TauE/SafE family protein [Candidatus Acidoferrum sp.]|nr:sulfite exporter TauE/SafE family protein [Candidatus Acidoferrum sp.]